MELVLNLVWLAIATIVVADFARRSAPDQKRFLMALGALSCALLLLFPAVSISDDLHMQPFFARGFLSNQAFSKSSKSSQSRLALNPVRVLASYRIVRRPAPA